MLSKLLIANRGEIAVRVARAPAPRHHKKRPSIDAW